MRCDDASRGLATARQMLTKLQTAHAELLAGIAAMQAVNDRADASPEQWIYSRWLLGRASRMRRLCVERACLFVLPAATPSERFHIRRLQAHGMAMRQTSRNYVAHWTPERIARDWRGYCAASIPMRGGVTDRIIAEQEILIPILKRMAA